ncbi:MAG: 16S rRNA (cytosine(1402)-N(4))-methyltransferase RsmH [Polyangiales bacterium]
MTVDGDRPRAFVHATVLLEEVVAAIAPHAGGLYADVTLGGAGHARALLEAGGEGAMLVGVDRDLTAISAAKTRLEDLGARVRFVHSSFADATTPLLEAAAALTGDVARRFDGVVADLGVSSPQLDDASRGMSFRRDASSGAIDMRMDTSRGATARELIASLDEDKLANVIFELGEERHSRKIARSIKLAETEGQLATTGDLRHAIHRATGGGRPGEIDPATRTFQALRIAVNDELGELDRLLQALPSLLAEGGAVAIISFHSLEDRRVKQAFRALADDAGWVLDSKKPIEASDAELARNPRSRSAKLRVIRRPRVGERSLDRRERYEAKVAARRAARDRGDA